MTWGQWLFEYEALRQKERGESKVVTDVLKLSARVVRDTFVSVLGLDQLVSLETRQTHEKALAAPRGADELPPARPFVPAAFVLGNHHLLAGYVDQAEKDGQAEKALADDAFEAFSAKLAKGDYSDMSPVLLGDAAFDQAARLREMQATLTALGVVPRPASAKAAPHVSAKPRRRGVVFESDVNWPDDEVGP